jgi:hypothetical protein
MLVLYFLSFCASQLYLQLTPMFCLDVFLVKGNYGFLTLEQVQAVPVFQ